MSAAATFADADTFCSDRGLELAEVHEGEDHYNDVVAFIGGAENS